MIDLAKGLKYPWGKPERLWNVLWFLIPILGWFALIGYSKKIVNEIVKGNTKTLPAFDSFAENLKTGFMVFLLLIPLMLLVWFVSIIPLVGKALSVVASLFLIPWLSVNLMQKMTLESTLEIKKASKIVFNNLMEYIMVILKSLLFSIVYGFLSIVLIGIPCLAFGKHIYLADFYANTLPKHKTEAKKPAGKTASKAKTKKKKAKKKKKKK